MKCDPGRCEDCDPDNTYIYPWGNPDAGIAIVGQQPALDHAKISECAFSMDIDGSAGRSKMVLIAIFAELGRSFDEFYWTNAYKCASRLSFDEEWACETLLRHELEDFQQAVALGNDAASALAASKIDHVQIWHPAYVLRDLSRFDDYLEQWENALQQEHRTLDRFS